MSMASLPVIKTEVAFANKPRDTSMTWVDISAYVLPGRTGRRGRSSESDTTQTGVRTLRLRNVDGRFDPANAASPHNTGSNKVRPMRAIRQTATFPDASTSVVFSGFVLGWPQVWTMNGRYGEATIQCVDVFRVLQSYKFGIRYFEQVGAHAPTWYFRDLTTNTGSSAGVSVVVVDALQGASDGATFTTVTGPTGGDSGQKITHPTAINSPDNASAGTGLSHFRNSTGGGRSNGSTVVEEVWWRPDTVPAVNGYFVKVIGPHVWTSATGASGDEVSVEARFDAAGATYQIRYFGNTNPIGTGTVIAGATTVRPTAGRWDHIALRQVYTSSTNKTYELYVNGILLASGTQTSNAFGASSSGYLGGAANVPAGFACSWSEWATYVNGDSGNTSVNAITTRAAYLSSYAEFPAQLSGDRVSQVLDAIGWPSAARVLDSGTVTLQATGSVKDKTALDLLQAAADAEIGNVFATADGKVAFTDRNHSPGASPAFILGDGAGELPYLADLSVGYDDQRIINDWTIAQDNSTPAYSVRVTDTTSADDYFPRPDSKSYPYANAADADATATYLLARTKDPHQRIETVTLDIAANPDLLPLYRDIDIGKWVRINRRPPYAPAIVVDCIVEQISETGGENTLKLTLSLSPKL